MIEIQKGFRKDFSNRGQDRIAPNLDNAHRYSPARVVEVIARPVWGQPDTEKICTSYVERQNLTMRMQIRKLT